LKPASGGRLFDRVMIVGGTPEDQRAIADISLQAHVLEIPTGIGIEGLTQRLQEIGPIQQVFWLAPPDPRLTPIQEGILPAQEEGVLACFRLIKAFLQLGYGSKTLGFTIITHQTRVLSATETINPTHAGLLG